MRHIFKGPRRCGCFPYTLLFSHVIKDTSCDARRHAPIRVPDARVSPSSKIGKF
ncbi:hypothetical protein HMPREF1155_0590 [Slackia sp. CM382]|nr:hypothetical protein HMPREF1155_0590 [Slackia sp. CM382]